MNSQEEKLFDENGELLPEVHKSHHIYIHARKTKEYKREEMKHTVLTSFITSLVVGGVMSIFGVIAWAFVQFVKNGGQI